MPRIRAKKLQAYDQQLCHAYVWTAVWERYRTRPRQATLIYFELPYLHCERGSPSFHMVEVWAPQNFSRCNLLCRGWGKNAHCPRFQAQTWRRRWLALIGCCPQPNLQIQINVGLWKPQILQINVWVRNHGQVTSDNTWNTPPYLTAEIGLSMDCWGFISETYAKMQVESSSATSCLKRVCNLR